jgi:hypothetical protein
MAHQGMSGGIREMGTGLLGAVKDTAGELLGGEGGDAEEMLDADSVEKMMCGSEDLTEGKMMEVEMEGANILLLRYRRSWFKGIAITPEWGFKEQIFPVTKIYFGLP